MLINGAWPTVLFLILFALMGLVKGDNLQALKDTEAYIYRKFEVIEEDDLVHNIKVVGTKPLAEEPDALPKWAVDVSQEKHEWEPIDPSEPYFEGPIPFVVPPPENSDEPSYRHHHQPDITWLSNGDLLAIWYNTHQEAGPELTVVAARLRSGSDQWDPAYEFFKASDRNMHGSSIFYDDKTGVLHHMNGMGRKGDTGFVTLALLHRYSLDQGVSWSAARPISTGGTYQSRHQVIGGMVRTADGTLIQPCDTTHRGRGSTALHVSRDEGRTWRDPGGNIRGIHASVEELKDGRLMAFGRGGSIEGQMPKSISDNMGDLWQYEASDFPVVGGGQRPVLMRLDEGPLLLVAFTGSRHNLDPEAYGMTFVDKRGNEYKGLGMYAALSYDEGETWPVRKLLTPGEGEYDGQGNTGVFEAAPNRAEHAGYLAATQTPDGVIHLISSGLHYRFNLQWIETPPEGTQ